MNRQTIAQLAVALALALPATGARAAGSFDTCTGFIAAVPVVISTQGTWCFRKDLATGIGTGAAITIEANNITIDCNGFKLGGLAAGPNSIATGIRSDDRLNATVRGCGIRGFATGIHLAGGGGHLIEDNRLDNNLIQGIFVSGDGNLVQRNRVFDTGGQPTSQTGTGINARADLIDNVVDVAFGVGTDPYAFGIFAQAPGTEVRGNRVRGLVAGGAGLAYGLVLNAPGIRVAGNSVTALGTTNGEGIAGTNLGTACFDNLVFNFTWAIPACAAGSGNVALP